MKLEHDALCRAGCIRAGVIELNWEKEIYTISIMGNCRVFICATSLFGLILITIIPGPSNARVLEGQTSQFQGVEPSNVAATERIGIFGADTRRRLPKHYSHLARSVGYLRYRYKRRYATCTVFCVSESVVATAGHCFSNTKVPATVPYNSSVITIGEGRNRLRSRIRGRNRIERQMNVISGCVGTSCSSAKLDDVQFDWAIVRMRKSICGARVLELHKFEQVPSIASLLEKDSIFAVGYPGDKSFRRATYAGDCSDGKDQAYLAFLQTVGHYLLRRGIMPHRCDISSGGSGGPIFMKQYGMPVTVVGIVSKAVKFRGKKPRSARTSNLAVLASSFQRQVPILERPYDVPGIEAMKGAQRFLNALELYAQRIDGIYGSRTRNAVLEVERKAQLIETGRPDQRLFDAATLAERTEPQTGLAYLRYRGDMASTAAKFRKSETNAGIWGARGIIQRSRFVPFKAFAFDAATGAWGWAFYQPSPQAAETVALRDCERTLRAVNGDDGEPAKRCRLYGLGDEVVYDKSGLDLKEVKRRYAFGVLRKAFSSFVRYREAEDHKAIVVDLATVTAGVSWAEATREAAIKKAFLACRSRSRHCSLFAAGSNVVLDTVTTNHDRREKEERNGQDP
ncbi:MAG: trypsin-like peptidase domain-containing protein [Rhizobiaceae bacterium]